MMPSSVLASCDDSGIAVGAKSIVSSAKTSTSTTGDKLPKAAIPSDGGVFIVWRWEMARCQRFRDSGNFVVQFLSLQRKKLKSLKFSNLTDNQLQLSN